MVPSKITAIYRNFWIVVVCTNVGIVGVSSLALFFVGIIIFWSRDCSSQDKQLIRLKVCYNFILGILQSAHPRCWHGSISLQSNFLFSPGCQILAS